MGKLIDKIMVVQGEAVELSPEITERMERIFNDAVDEELHSYYVEGIEDVLETMEELNIKGVLKLVEQKLIEKKILVSADKENDDEESDDEEDKKKRNSKRGSIKEGYEYASEISKMIG